jgi:hypothetical protein
MDLKDAFNSLFPNHPQNRLRIFVITSLWWYTRFTLLLIYKSGDETSYNIRFLATSRKPIKHFILSDNRKLSPIGCTNEVHQKLTVPYPPFLLLSRDSNERES